MTIIVTTKVLDQYNTRITITNQQNHLSAVGEISYSNTDKYKYHIKSKTNNQDTFTWFDTVLTDENALTFLNKLKEIVINTPAEIIQHKILEITSSFTDMISTSETPAPMTNPQEAK